MDQELTRSAPARLVAMGFIALILLGNCWFVLTIIGQRLPSWFPLASSVIVSGVIGGGVWLGILALRNHPSDGRSQ